MSKIKYILFLVLLLPTIVFASDGYEINSCVVEASINDKNNYEYNEIVDFLFDKSNVLITKRLPLNTSDIMIDKDYFIETTDNKLLKIYSNEYRKIQYDIKYTIKNETNKKNDYKMNLCSSYNNSVDEIEFHLNLPYTIESDNVIFYLNDEIIYDIPFEIKDNILTGTYDNLKENDILSVEIKYDNLYFNKYTALCIVLPMTFALMSGILWYIYGKDIKYRISRISKLPSSINLLNIALVNDGIVTYEEAYYLMLDLANRGYIKIIAHKNNKYTIKRAKEYDGKDYIEAAFLKSLFRKTIRVSIAEYIDVVTEGKKSKIKELVKEIPDNEIHESFKRACTNILSIINTNEEKTKYFELKSDSKKIYLVIMIVIILILVTSYPFIKINKLYLLPLSVLFSIVTLYILINFVTMIDLRKNSNKIQVFLLAAAITMVVILMPSFKYNRIYIIAFLISIISVVIILFFYKYMPKRTIYGTKVFAKIESFKLFLDELRDEDLKVLLEQQPNYLLDILPASLLIGRGELVIKKMKQFNIKEPSWFKLEDGYTETKLYNSIERLKNRIRYLDE